MERSRLGGWVWGAVHELPEPMRAAAMLRFFGRFSSYEEIAAILGVPVGTVRSRLANARARLAAALLATAQAADTGARELAAAQRREFGARLAELNRGASAAAFAAAFARDVRMELADGLTLRGHRTLRSTLDEDIAAGVRLHLTSVLASPTVTILEGRLESPPSDPLRCPPATCQVHFRTGGETTRVRLYFAPRASADAPAS